MENRKKSTLLGAAVIGLIVLNVCLLTFMLLRGNNGDGQKQGEPGKNGPPPPEILVKALALNETQKEQFVKLRNWHISTMNVCVEANKRYRDTLFSQLSSGKDEAYGYYADSIAANQKRMELITFKHFADLRAICTAEQKQTFDKMIKDVIRLMSRRKLWEHKPGEQDTAENQN